MEKNAILHFLRQEINFTVLEISKNLLYNFLDVQAIYNFL